MTNPATEAAILPFMTPALIRRTGLVLCSLLLPLSAQEKRDLRELLRDALYTEEVTRDPEAAAKQYEALLAKHDADRAFAAAALFRLAEVRRKQDRKDEAIALYQRLLRDFPAAEAEGKLARENLVAMGAPAGSAAEESVDEEARELQRLRQWVESSPDRLKDPQLLLTAVKEGRLRSIELLLEAGAAGKPWELLDAAVRTGNLDTIDYLLDHPFEGHRGLDQALFLAVSLEYADVTKLLLNRGAKPVSQGMHRISEHTIPPSTKLARMSPLHVAVRKGDLELCKLLLANGADPNLLPDHLRHRALQEIKNGYPAGTPLHDAVGSSLEITRFLLDHGANAKTASPDTGVSALHCAVLFDGFLEENADLIKLLVEKGADLEAVTARKPDERQNRRNGPVLGQNDRFPPGYTPLKLAVFLKNTHAVRRLIEAGAKADDPELIPLAVRAGATETVRLLVSRPGKHEITPDTFMDAVGLGDEAMIRLLVEAGANPSAHSELHGSTPLRFAVGRSSLDLLKLLLELGATPEPAWAAGNFQGASFKALPLLHHRFLVPELQKRVAVTLILPSFGPSTPPAELSAGKNSESPLPLATLLLRQRMSWPTVATDTAEGFPMQLTVFRKGETQGTSMKLDDEGELPALNWGDVVELSPDWKSLGGEKDYNIEYRTEIPAHARWHLMKRIAFPVTVEIDGKTREITLRGDRLIYDPGSDTLPLLGATGLASLLWQPESDASGLARPAVTVARKGWPDITVPWNATNDFPLEPADRVIVTTPPPPADLAEIRKKQIVLAGAGVPFRHRHWIESPTGAPSLLQAIAELTGWWAERIPDSASSPDQLLNSGISLPLRLLPHPDYSKIVIRRLAPDGSETRIPFDLAAAIAASDPTPEAARKADLPLLGGDIVEVPQLPGKAGTPWQGPSPEEARFFAMALDCRVQVVTGDGEIELREVRYQPPRFVEMAGQWIPVSAVGGSSSLAADAALGRPGNAIHLTRRGGRPREAGRTGTFFLRDGDVVELPVPRQRAVPPAPLRLPNRVVPPTPSR
jgi:ankyrin repeat protein